MASRKKKEEALLKEMFPDANLSEIEAKATRNLLAPFMDAYFDLEDEET